MEPGCEVIAWLLGVCLSHSLVSSFSCDLDVWECEGDGLFVVGGGYVHVCLRVHICVSAEVVEIIISRLESRFTALLANDVCTVDTTTSEIVENA